LGAQSRIESLDAQIVGFKQNIESLKNDVLIQTNERQALQEKIENQASEIVLMKEDNSKIKQKAFEDIEEIRTLRM